MDSSEKDKKQTEFFELSNSVSLDHDGDEDFDPASDSELPACKHCGRVVLAGPPCCYHSLYGLYFKATREIAWLRKVQGRQAKTIQSLSQPTYKVRNLFLPTNVEAIVIAIFLAAFMICFFTGLIDILTR